MRIRSLRPPPSSRRPPSRRWAPVTATSNLRARNYGIPEVHGAHARGESPEFKGGGFPMVRRMGVQCTAPSEIANDHRGRSQTRCICRLNIAPHSPSRGVLGGWALGGGGAMVWGEGSRPQRHSCRENAFTPPEGGRIPAEGIIG